ncbi:MAG: hypothetical protein IPH77_15595 [Ignavibacteria bacterium]|nr:hypothetical protein [Ignavibacteria bacterium]
MPGKIRIIIADDHPIFRGGLRQIISADDSIEDNRERRITVKKALEIIHELKPGIAVLTLICLKKQVLMSLEEPKDS